VEILIGNVKFFLYVSFVEKNLYDLFVLFVKILSKKALTQKFVSLKMKNGYF